MKIKLLYKGIVLFALMAHQLTYAQLSSNALLGDSVSLKQVLATALENNFSIQVSRNDATIASNNNTYGNAGFMPTIGVSSGWSQDNKHVEQEFLNNPDRKVIDPAKRDMSNLNVGLNWTLFDGMRMFATKSQLQELSNLGEKKAKIVIDNALATISDLYYSIVLEEAKLKVMEEILQVSDTRKQMVIDKQEVGRASYQEKLAAQVDYNADKTMLIRQRNLLQSQKIALLSLVGINADLTQTFRVNDQIALLDHIELSNILNSYNVHNPSLLAVQREQNVAYQEIKKIQAEQFPSLSFSTGYTMSDMNANFGNLAASQERGFNYGFTLSWNVFDGFNTRRQKGNAKIEYENRKLLYQEQEVQIKNEILSAYLNYTNNIKLVDLEKQNKVISVENVEIAMERYRIGKADFVEFRTVQNNYAEAANRYLETIYTVKLNETELLRLSGEISKVLFQ